MSERQLKNILLAIWGTFMALVLLTMAWSTYGQAKEKEYKLSEVQSLKLQVKQKDALLAKAAMESAQQRFQQTIIDLTAEGEKIKTENKWDAKTQFDPNTLVFSEPAPPAKEDKKEPAKEPAKP